jgi:hypothetical protein
MIREFSFVHVTKMLKKHLIAKTKHIADIPTLTQTQLNKKQICTPTTAKVISTLTPKICKNIFHMAKHLNRITTNGQIINISSSQRKTVSVNFQNRISSVFFIGLSCRLRRVMLSVVPMSPAVILILFDVNLVLFLRLC